MDLASERLRAASHAASGFFEEDDVALFDFLLTLQNTSNWRGHFVEIGVLHGKAALYAAAFLDPAAGDRVALVDINPVDEVLALLHVNGFVGAAATAFTGRSSAWRTSDTFAAVAGRARLVHVDGDHTGWATQHDLALATECLGPRGVIVVDDFFSHAYPQLTAAVFKFLDARRDLTLFVMTQNKGYVCRAEDFAFYDEMNRRYLPEHLKAHGLARTLRLSAPRWDGGVLSVRHRIDEYDFMGHDDTREHLPAD